LTVHRRLGALLLASAVVLLGACDNAQIDASVAAPVPLTLSLEATPAASGASDFGITAAPSAPQVSIAPVQNPLLVAIDPGHGGDEVGAAANGVVERDSNLDMARRVERFLREGGAEVLLTREDSGRAPGALTGSGFSATRGDLQARVRAANTAGAAVFVSLHSNGSPELGQRGIEVYYESRREFADENRRLAAAVLDGALQGLASAGYVSRNRGVIDAACWRNNNGRCIGLFVLSPAGAATSSTNPSAPAKEATSMPAVLAELLFISNHDDAALLRNEIAREAMARGVADGILRYLGVAE
jgi:N-acetylmuramoyl-L-alanine amidase